MTEPGKRPRSRRPGYITRARWAAFWLIAFMLWMAFVPMLSFSMDPTGAITAHVKEWLFIVLLLYLAVELDETARRNATNQEGFIKDNGLALAGILIGFATFVLWALKPGYKLTPDQFKIVLQCMLVVSIDFAYCLILSQRIAFAGKERAETEEH